MGFTAHHATQPAVRRHDAQRRIIIVMLSVLLVAAPGWLLTSATAIASHSHAAPLPTPSQPAAEDASSPSPLTSELLSLRLEVSRLRAVQRYQEAQHAAQLQQLREELEARVQLEAHMVAGKQQNTQSDEEQETRNHGASLPLPLSVTLSPLRSLFPRSPPVPVAAAAGAPASPPWLVVIDMQYVFSSSGGWATPRFAQIAPRIARLVKLYSPRVVFTRFTSPPDLKPVGQWVPYYRQWPFALVSDESPIYDLVRDVFPLGSNLPVVSRDTFGKFDRQLADLVGGPSGGGMLLTGVSTDCCVLSTALTAADAGMRVRIVSDACAGSDDAAHQRALASMSAYAPLVEIIDVDTAAKEEEERRKEGVKRE